MGKFTDLDKDLLNKLKPQIEYWYGKEMDTSWDLNKDLPINTSHLTLTEYWVTGYQFCAQHAINYAIYMNEPGLVKVLCRNGADPELHDDFLNKNSLELAAHYGRATILEYLLDYKKITNEYILNYQNSIFEEIKTREPNCLSYFTSGFIAAFSIKECNMFGIEVKLHKYNNQMNSKKQNLKEELDKLKLD